MRLDTTGLDRPALVGRIEEAWQLEIGAIAYLPRGEASHHYRVEARDGQRYVARVQEAERATDLESRFAAASRLSELAELRAVLAPLPTRDGRFVVDLGRYLIALTPLIDAPTAEEAGIEEAALGRVAELLARLHRTRSPAPLPRERFGSPFEAPVRSVLAWAGGGAAAANDHQARLRDLVDQERAGVEVLLDRLARLGTLAAVDQPGPAEAASPATSRGFGPTHGDPNLANLLVGPGGRLHLIDWEELALGPPERDLQHFTGERFEPFLRAYLAAGGADHLLHDRFAYYAWRWVAQEVADYSTRILFRTRDPAEDDHAWAELAPYLPIPAPAVERRIARTTAILRRLGVG